MNEMVHITACLNPISREIVTSEIPASGSLSDHIKVPDHVLIERNGKEYRNGQLKPGDTLTMVAAPRGGDQGKDIARTALVLAAVAFAPAAGIALGLKAGSLGLSLFVGAATFGAQLGASALIPPADIADQIGDQEQFKRLGALTGTRNRLNPYGVVPRVYGHRKIYPPLSAKPFTEIFGSRQDLRLLFNLGPGPLELSKPMIGDAIVGEFDSNNVFTSNDKFKDLEIEVGESPDLYSNTVEEQSVNVDLDEVSDTATRTTEAEINEISLDILFPSGLFAVNDELKSILRHATFKIEYRKTGVSEWTELFAVGVAGLFYRSRNIQYNTGDGGWQAVGLQRQSKRSGISWKVFEPGPYEVRVTRITASQVSEDVSQIFEDASWTILRSIDYTYPTNLPGTVQLAMRVQATDQINGVLDQFSVEVKSRLAFYDGAAWQVPTFDPENGSGTGGLITSNPAWIMADILSGGVNARPIPRERLDGASFKAWADNAGPRGDECNIILDVARTVLQTAGLIGASARGSLSMRDNGIYTIIQDTDETVPVQHFTPRNSWGFTSVRNFIDAPHGLRVQFPNEDENWQPDEGIVYDDGYSLDGSDCVFPGPGGSCSPATRFESMSFEGVTNWEQAWREGRYRLAELRLRPERYQINTDFENLVCTRGDLVFVTHDVSLWGLASGRIKSIASGTVTLDEPVQMESGKTYNLRVRSTSGGSLLKVVSTAVGLQSTITLSNTSGITQGDLFMFGETAKETQALKVLSVEPIADLGARLTLIDAAPAIYDADQETIPDFDSNTSNPPPDLERLEPPAPTIVSIRSGTDSLTRTPDGVPSLRLVVAFQVGSGNPTGYVEGRYRKSGDSDGWSAFGVSEASSGTLTLFDVELGSTYIIQIRARTGDRVSSWVEGDPHTAGEGVEEETFPPKEIFEIITESDAIGRLITPVNGEVSSLHVNLFGFLTPGDVIDFMIEKRSVPTRVLVAKGAPPVERYDSGVRDIAIQEQNLKLPAGTFFKLNGVSLASRFHVDPGKIQGLVERNQRGDSVGTVVEALDKDEVFSTIVIRSEDAIELLDGQILKIRNKQGEFQDVVIDGDQTTIAGTPWPSGGTNTILDVVSNTALYDYPVGVSTVFEAGYKLTGRLTIEAGKVALNATNISDQGSSIAGLTLDVSGNQTAIAALDTHVNIAGGSAYSGLTLKSQIGTNEADLSNSIRSATPPTLRPSGEALKSGDTWVDTSDNDRAYIWDGTAWTKVDKLIDVNASAILSADSNITNLQTDSNHVFRQIGAPTIRPSGEVLQTGDVWVDTDDSNRMYSYNGTAWEVDNALMDVNASASLNLDSRIIENDGEILAIESTAVLKVDANGKIAFVALSAAHDGTTIDISADQVNFDTERLNVGSEVSMGTGLGTLEGGTNQVLIGLASVGVPYVRVQRNATNYVQMVGRTDVGENIIEAAVGGEIVFAVDGTGVRVGSKGGEWKATESDGIEFDISGIGWISKRGLNWVDGVTDKLRIYSAPSMSKIETLNGAKLAIISDTALDINADTTIGLFADEIFANAPIVLINLTTTQMNALSSPSTGSLIFNTTVGRIAFYTGTEWRQVESATV